MKNKLTGWTAIEAKENNDAIVLCKYSDPTEGERENLTADEARQIAKEDPSLIYVAPKFNEVCTACGNILRCDTGDYRLEIDLGLTSLQVIDGDSRHATYDISEGDLNHVGGDEDFDWPDKLAEQTLAVIKLMQA